MFNPKQAFQFLPKVIRKEVERNRIGVYILGDYCDNVFVPKYVGRSDFCVQQRLLTHNHLYQFQYFCFVYRDTAEQAFYLESQLWHDLDCQFLANAIHPDRPSGSHLVCPYCQYAHFALSDLQIG